MVRTFSLTIFFLLACKFVRQFDIILTCSSCFTVIFLVGSEYCSHSFCDSYFTVVSLSGSKHLLFILVKLSLLCRDVPESSAYQSTFEYNIIFKIVCSYTSAIGALQSSKFYGGHIITRVV